MKYYELTKEEEALLSAFEKGEFVSDENLEKSKLLYQKIARNTLNKAKNINIRLSEKVIAQLKAKAAAEGMPYQTLVSSVLHKYANS